MKQLSADTLLNIIEYEKVRKEYRSDIINYKKDRRIKIGPNITVVFENERTLSFQIQEIMRAERIVHDEKIQEEVTLKIEEEVFRHNAASKKLAPRSRNFSNFFVQTFGFCINFEELLKDELRQQHPDNFLLQIHL